MIDKSDKKTKEETIVIFFIHLLDFSSQESTIVRKDNKSECKMRNPLEGCFCSNKVDEQEAKRIVKFRFDK